MLFLYLCLKQIFLFSTIMRRLLYSAFLICIVAIIVCCDRNDLQHEKNGDKVQVNLSFNVIKTPLTIGGTMAGTKGTNEDLFDALYEGIITGDIVAPYDLTFKNKKSGVSISFNGKWSDNQCISIEKGDYTITGTSEAIGKGIYDQCSLTFEDEVTITEKTRSISVKAKYNCSLLILNDDNVDKILYYASENDSIFFATYNGLTYAFLKSSEDFKQGDSAYLKVFFKNGISTTISLGEINLQNGKYYLLENLNNYTDVGLVLDIDKMQDGGDINYRIPFVFSSANQQDFIMRTFTVGESMAVWGIQSKDGVVDTIFKNQKVEYVGNNEWTYENKKYLDDASTYNFYSVYPYDVFYERENTTYGLLASIDNYTTPKDVDQQTDLLIAERKVCSSPTNMVDMSFHHILSNVNIYAKLADDLDMDGIKDVNVIRLTIKGIKNTGSYTQTKFDERNIPVGIWSNQSGELETPIVSSEMHKEAKAILSDYLIIPQTLFDTDNPTNDVHIEASFRISYTDGTSSTYIKNDIRLLVSTSETNNPINIWQPNFRYNYTLTFDPRVYTRIWDADGDGSLIIDPISGDTISKNDDTPTSGTMKYNPDEHNYVFVFEDTDGNGKPDTWNKYPLAWENIDDDVMNEAGIDRDQDGHIDNVDRDNNTNMHGHSDHDPTDGNNNNPSGKDVLLIHYDCDSDGDIDEDDEWIQLQMDPYTGSIQPYREVEARVVSISAEVSDWD